jgi:uncharacterized protein (TIGR02996 family)
VDELRVAMAAEDWATALARALASWRELRAPELAELIDVVGARCAPPVPASRRELHAWWLRHARGYDPTAVSALVATAGEQAWRTPPNGWAELVKRQPNNPVIAQLVGPHAELLAARPWMMTEAHRVERLAVLLPWPDDPRTATLLARWFVEAPISWIRPCDDSARAFYTLIAERLIALADVRVLGRIEALVAEPRAKTPELRAHQSELARRIVAELATPAALDEPTRAQLVAWCAPRQPPPRTLDEDALWAEVARNPDDTGARLVLADALLEHGDPRGELIAIQCSPTTPTTGFQSRQLIARHWDAWLGDVALVLDQRGCEFHRGMLEVVRVGQRATPEWAFTKVRGHRELACVRVVRPSYRMTPAQYLGFVRDLPRPPQRLGVTHAVVEQLAGLPPVTELEYDHARFRYPRVELLRTLELVARVMPDLEELEIHVQPRDAGAASAAIPAIRALFPRLEHLQIE